MLHVYYIDIGSNWLSVSLGFYGRNNLDALAIDEVVQSMLDLKTDILLNIFQKDQEKKVCMIDLDMTAQNFISVNDSTKCYLS